MRVLAVLFVVACGTGPAAGPSTTPAPTTPPVDLDLDLDLCEAGNGPFTATVDNPYLPLVVGAVHVLAGLEGGSEPASFRLEVSDETADVGGVTARVVVKTDLSEATPGVPEREFYAQAADGTVCQFGVDEDSDGELELEAGVDGVRAGIFMPAEPMVGMRFAQVHEADGEETAEITSVGTETIVAAGTFPDTVTVLEDGPSVKKYARDVGEIYDDGIELVSY